MHDASCGQEADTGSHDRRCLSVVTFGNLIPVLGIHVKTAQSLRERGNFLTCPVAGYHLFYQRSALSVLIFLPRHEEWSAKPIEPMSALTLTEIFANA